MIQRAQRFVSLRFGQFVFSWASDFKPGPHIPVQVWLPLYRNRATVPGAHPHAWIVLENRVSELPLDLMASTCDFHKKSAAKLMPSNFTKLTRSTWPGERWRSGKCDKYSTLLYSERCRDLGAAVRIYSSQLMLYTRQWLSVHDKQYIGVIG